MNTNILVIGGTGKTGSRVAQRLQQLGHNIRIGSRSATPAFDWEKPETWATVMEGIEKMYITFQPDLAVPGALEAIEALTKQAQKSSVKKMVLLSGKGEREAELCEQVVINSGIDYTIVRASWFNQNFSESFLLEPLQAGLVALPQPDAEVPYVDTKDIADVAVAALLHDKHNGEIYELTGTRTLTFKEVVTEIATATKRDITFISVTLEAYTQVMQQQEVPADVIWLINYLFTEVLGDERNSEITNDIEKVLGRKPKDFSLYVTETAATGIWNTMPSIEN
ncbi:NmrA family transcriptional regulator [Flavobacterium arcticum]|uniref:NmrA family transcriptional regulator n=1 Tax=Flavobacterium arcticum TaxID=1784713 RepID=A0A345HBU0_9FLAO|nr:NmrA family NAD(P)-binding protein [Flavobacterium arcticum]AXG74050.1 NmrA family transcriptional regulator [Flavobacterium arcticum]KAF2509025.1 NAD(P)H-binding protein [Flavobacterium arcticum]